MKNLSYFSLRFASSLTGLLLLVATPLPAASSSPDARHHEIRMLVDSPDGRQRSRGTRDGIMDPVGLRPNESIRITLDFPNQFAGAPLVITPMDGGQISAGLPDTLPASGKVTFTYRADNDAGMCRIFVQCLEQYQVRVFVVDPSQRPSRRQHPGAQ